VWTCHALWVLNVIQLLKSSGLVFFVKISSKCPNESDIYILISYTIEVWLHFCVHFMCTYTVTGNELCISSISLAFCHCNPSWWSFSIFSDYMLPLPLSVDKHIFFVASGSYWLVLQQDLWLYSTLTSTDGIMNSSRGTKESSVQTVTLLCGRFSTCRPAFTWLVIISGTSAVFSLLKSTDVDV